MRKILIAIIFLLSIFIVEAQQQGETCKVASERINDLYCSIDGFWELQKDTDASCINNFECTSEICQNNVCQTQDIVSLLTQALNQLNALPPAQPSGGSTGGSGGSSVSTGIISSFQKAASGCFPEWNCTQWSPCINGKKTRTCKDNKGCKMDLPYFKKPAETMLCMLLLPPSCTDGIKNQNEEGIDCGGSCDICKTCYDSEQNCHDGSCEEGIDCGGPCDLCSKGFSKPVWVSLISSLLLALIIIVGLLYWRLKGEAKEVGKEEVTWEHHHKKPSHKTFRL